MNSYRGRKKYNYNGRSRYTKKRKVKYGVRWNGGINYRPGSHYPGHMVPFRTEEMKFVDMEMDVNALTTSWATHEPAATDSISAVATGDGESNRDGRVYYIHSVHLNGRCDFGLQESVGAPPSDIIFRVIVVVDKQTNGAQLTATDVMDAGQTDDFHAFRNLQFTQRFWVLYDNLWSLDLAKRVTNEGATNLFANGIGIHLWKMNYTFNTPLKVTCSNTTAVIASITDNSIHVIAIASSTSTTISYQSRVRFTD